MWFLFYFAFFYFAVPQLLLRTDAISYRPIFIYKRLLVCVFELIF